MPSYHYRLDPVEQVPALVPACAGNRDISVVCVGDSIVSTYSESEYRQGRGESLRQKLSHTTITNNAASGRSSKSFINEGRWDTALDEIDSTSAAYVLIEFGHNDNPGKGDDRTTDPREDGDFRDYIRQYIDDTRDHGAIPILVTSPPRRSFSNGEVGDTGNQSYAEAMIAVAQEQSCSVVDLNTQVRDLFNGLGQDGS